QRARQEVASAEARYEEATRRLEKAREAREEAADALEEAREELAEARAEVGRYATDDAIFRAVQSRLLKDEKLSEVAIPVRVQNGVVILTGEVPKEDLEERAVGIANEVAGVIEVKSRIQVRDRPKEPRSEEGRGESGDEGGGSASEGRRSGGGASQGEAAAQEE
ncbi:MAG: BON domain-containing protein, partial [Myxococcota bacterium]|nr:BON domain-containing protein [Myxococcota bacterium]